MTRDVKISRVLAAGAVLGAAVAFGSVAQASVLSIDNINWGVGNNNHLPATATHPNGQWVSGGYHVKFLQGYNSNLVSSSNPEGFTGAGFGYLDGLGSTSGFTQPYCSSGASCLLTFTFGNISPGSTDAYINIYAHNGAGAFNTFNSFWNGLSNTSPPTDISSQMAYAGSGTLFLSTRVVGINLGTTPISPGDNQYSYSLQLAPTSVGGQTGSANWTLQEDPNFFMNLGGVEPNTSYTVQTGVTTQNGQQEPVYATYYGATGTGNYHAVPEPNDLGMMGLGLLMVGLLGLRFRQSKFRRN